MSRFAHLHLHTQFSLLDGANKIGTVVGAARDLGQPAIAITDHGNLHGAIEFYLAASKAGVKPLIGCELYVAGGSRFDRTPKAQGGPPTHHLTVLAASSEGYHNLCRLSSLAFKEGFYFKPRVDHELLARHREGLVVLSGCLAGEFAHWALRDDRAKVLDTARFFASTFGDRYHLEIQPHLIPEQQKVNAVALDVGRELGIGVVATTDCHYTGKDDHYAQEVLMCISTGTTVDDPARMRHDGVELYLKSADEMLASFAATDVVPPGVAASAVAASADIAARCDVRFGFDTYYMPRFSQASEDEHLASMAAQAREGLARRLAATGTTDGEGRYADRLEREIRLIGEMGFGSYFLVVSDFIVWAKENGIPVGPGRGSCAGSLVAYAMRITDVDPIRHKLLFERFLNPERVSLPDIDVDFCIEGRSRVIQYVVEKYGSDKVAQISTFGTLKAKAAIKDVGRALGMSYAETDRVAQLVPAPRQGFDYPLAEALKMEKRLAEYAEGEGRELVSLAMKLEGLTRHTSTHAAGVVIGDRPLVELLPMMVDKDGNDVTQYSMSYVEKCGLVKFDFLGLKTLTVIRTAQTIIEKSRGKKVDLETLGLDDRKTFRLLAAANTTGVFQLESSGITEVVARLKPSTFDDLVAILALYRPGPLDAGMVDRYVERKHGRETVSYLHPKMQGVLSDTYGIMLYQEQIMQLARDLAGYSLAEADILRKAMGKKNPDEMAKQRDRFASGCAAGGLDRRLADEIFDQMETFARYGFNRSHSVAYALISYQTAYLKAHYGVEFMAALMSLEMEDSDKTLKNLTDCRRQGIAVLPPDVNVSEAGFSVQDGKIRYGLEAVRGIGGKAVEAILAARDSGGPFLDFEQFFERVDLRSVNKRVVESLVKCGAFDYTGVARAGLFRRVEDTFRLAQAARREADSSQMSLFGKAGSGPAPLPRPAGDGGAEWRSSERLSFEREALGFYISGHPLERYEKDLGRLATCQTVDVREKRRVGDVKVAGVVTGLRLKNTKKGDRYASFVLEDTVGTVEALVWPDVYADVAEVLTGEEPVLVTARADVTDERCTLIVSAIEPLGDLRSRRATAALLRLRADESTDERARRLTELLGAYSGQCPLKVHMEVPAGAARETVEFFLGGSDGSPVRVGASEALCDEMEKLFGRPVLSYL